MYPGVIMCISYMLDEINVLDNDASMKTVCKKRVGRNTQEKDK